MTIRTQTPAEWVSADVPCFAVVGKVNMGKSAVLATLLEEDDDRIIRISPEPGETTRCQRLSLVLDGAERLRFIDTPGFQQPIEALRAIRAVHGEGNGTPGRAALQAFVDQYRDRGEFEDECRLLEPLLQGAGILYVVDPGVAVYDSFLAEIEILRFSGRARLALLNQRGEQAGTYEAEWREHLGKAFNLVRVFDAHRARFASRRDLLAALNQIDERDREHLQTTTALLDAEWQQRREEAAERIQAFLRSALELREHGHYADDVPAAETAKREAVKQASLRYFERIAALERETANDLLRVYRHTAVQAEAMQGFSDDLDLASDETWRRLGLTRQQLTVVGAAVGASAGIGVDAATFGHSFGLGALIGGLGGGALAFFKGDALPTLRLDLARVGPLGGQRITVGPPRNPNFAWVLLDSILIRYRQILSRAHARRGDAMLEGQAADGSIARALDASQQKTLARWFRSVTRQRDAREQDSAAYDALVAVLESIERSL
ncbi:GTP-binding protein HSR1-like protein [Salinisphaera sp. T5B8]|uniref:DUF3482 domain-containing protein n=1 Tax=unclassified Salinisphaera TaxID=2649847 RepID=UPI0033418A2C